MVNEPRKCFRKARPKLWFALPVVIVVSMLALASVSLRQTRQGNDLAPLAPMYPVHYRTVHIVGVDVEAKCKNQYNYLCKFYFSIRCQLLRDFVHVRHALSIEAAMASASPHDIVLMVLRTPEHVRTPHALKDALELRRWSTTRIGVLHTADERRRGVWKWYSQADFVLRNYWAPQPTALYVPLAAQFPDECTPNLPTDPTACACANGKRALLAASNRKYLWSFSGSIRRNRAKLLAAVKTLPRGITMVVSKFGGFGRPNPKRKHLELIRNSAFVFAPCGNVMETHRIYEALELGAIPLIEDCEGLPRSEFFPMREIVLKDAEAMIGFIRKYERAPSEVLDRLQRRVMMWWHNYSQELATNVTRTIINTS